MDRREFLIAGALSGTVRALKLDAPPELRRIRLSSLVPRLANQGWGVLLYDASIDCRPMRTGERTFAHGVHTHARSDLV